MGAYDDDEHERRERKNSEVELSEDDDRMHARSVDYDGDESTEELLDQFKQINSD